MPDWTKIREPAQQHCPWFQLGEAFNERRIGLLGHDVLDAVRGPVDSKVQIRIVEYDIRRLSTKLECHVLQVRPRCRFHDFPPDESGPGEGDLIYAEMFRDGLTCRVTVTSDDVDDAGGKPASMTREHMRSAVRGVNSEGLSTIVLPVARAGPNFHASIRTDGRR